MRKVESFVETKFMQAQCLPILENVAKWNWRVCIWSDKNQLNFMRSRLVRAGAGAARGGDVIKMIITADKEAFLFMIQYLWMCF